MLPRLRLGLVLGLATAAGETVAALGVRATEPAFLALQAGLIVLGGLALALVPLPRRALAPLPLAALGAAHLGRLFLLLKASFGLPQAGALALHGLAACAGVFLLVGRASDERWLPRVAAVAGAAALVQSAGCALLLVPATHAPLGGKIALGLALATALPLAAAWGARRALAGRRSFAAIPVALALLFFTLHGSFAWRIHERIPPGSATPPGGAADVLWIVLDTTRADRTSLYGNARPTTPNLAAFAEGATTYLNAVSQGVWTLPGHASMFTGLYPSEHRADWLERGMSAARLRREAITSAERFRMAGWRTGGVAANSFLFGRGFGLDQGFEVFWAEPGLSSQLPVPYVVSDLVHRFLGQGARQRIGALEQNQYAPAREVNRLGLELFDRLEGDRPRLVFLNYMEAHGLLRREPCPAPVFGEGRAFGEWDLSNVEEMMAGREDGDPAGLRRLVDWYDSQLACLDHHLGELFEALKTRGLYDDLLIVITSDHGHMLGEHRALKHKGEVWQGLVGVPLVVKLPGQTRGTVCEQVVETADLALAVPLLAGVPLDAPVPAWAGTPGFEPRPRGAPVVAGVREASWGGPLPPCPLPGRGEGAVSEAARQGELAEKYPWRWDRSHLAFRVGDLKLMQDTAGERWVADLGGGALDVPRPPTPGEAALLDRLLEMWRADRVPAPEAVESADDFDAEERLEALRKQGYVGG